MDNKILGSVVFFAVLAIAFLGNGITGMTTGDTYTKPLCESNDDCPGEVCCPFQGKTVGVCDLQDKCAAISELTMEQYDITYTPNNDRYWGQIIIGILMIIGIFFILYYSVHMNPKKR